MFILQPPGPLPVDQFDLFVRSALVSQFKSLDHEPCDGFLEAHLQTWLKLVQFLNGYWTQYANTYRYNPACKLYEPCFMQLCGLFLAIQPPHSLCAETDIPVFERLMSQYMQWYGMPVTLKRAALLCKALEKGESYEGLLDHNLQALRIPLLIVQDMAANRPLTGLDALIQAAYEADQERESVTEQLVKETLVSITQERTLPALPLSLALLNQLTQLGQYIVNRQRICSLSQSTSLTLFEKSFELNMSTDLLSSFLNSDSTLFDAAIEACLADGLSRKNATILCDEVFRFAGKIFLF